MDFTFSSDQDALRDAVRTFLNNEAGTTYVRAMADDSGRSLTRLRVDGGATANNLLMQSLADVLDVPVVRPIVAETPSLGAAYAAGLAVGFWKDLDELRANWAKDKEWQPAMNAKTREKLYSGWKKAVTRTFDWVE